MTNKIHNAFFYSDARAINKARTEHIDRIGLDLKDKSILETGCGGVGDITTKLLEYTNNITLNDAREDNIKNLMSTIGKQLEYNTSDLNEECPGSFDVIISMGTLYHLDKPSDAIKYMSQATKEMLVISTCSNGCDTGISFPTELGQNQSFTGVGCRPGRLWVKDELKKHFEYVYFVKTQPQHIDFVRDWSRQPVHGAARFMIIGSHIELDNPNLTTELPVIYKEITQ